jgi:hypothetical protein
MKKISYLGETKQESRIKTPVYIQKWGRGISCCYHGAWLFSSGEDSGDSDSAPLTPLSLTICYTLYEYY